MARFWSLGFRVQGFGVWGLWRILRCSIVTGSGALLFAGQVLGAAFNIIV